MARTSNITFGQVAQIADAMKAAGTRPTARAVRERIGSGSMGTIHNLLKQWQGNGSNAEETEAAELPEHIQAALMDFIGTEIATACEPLNDELQAAKAAADDIAQENERLHHAFAQQGTELESNLAALAVARGQLQEVKAELSEIKTERDKIRHDYTAALRELDNRERQLEMFAGSHQELLVLKEQHRDALASLHETEKNAAVLSAQLEAEKKTSNELDARLKTAESRASTANEEAKQANNHYQAMAARLEAAAREIESLRKPIKAPAALKVAAKKPAKTASNGNS